MAKSAVPPLFFCDERRFKWRNLKKQSAPPVFLQGFVFFREASNEFSPSLGMLILV